VKVTQATLQKQARAAMWDISTAHLTKADAEILKQGEVTEFPRTLPHHNGFIVFVDSSQEGSGRAGVIFRQRGMSETFIDLYFFAARDSKAPILINFDSDGQMLDLPSFDW
jgi:hypothetical protein